MKTPKLYSKMDRSNAALLVIDVINSCAHEKCEIEKWNIRFSKIRKMVPELVKFISLYRENAGGLVLFANTVPWRKEYLQENLNELYTDPYANYYSTDESGFAGKFYLVKPELQDIVITKNSYDAFSGTNLEKMLQEKGIKYLVIAGIFGDGCVMATICGGFSRGFNFVMLEDFIETTDVPVRQEILKNLKTFTWPAMYGKTMKGEEFLRCWQEEK